MALRVYQREALDAVREHYEQGITKQLIVLPTGTGKTQVAAHVPETIGLQPGEQLLFLVHRDELVFQAEEKFKHYNPTLKVEIEKAEYRASPDADCVIASVQTLGRKGNTRITKFNPETFRVIYIDEAHHAIAQQYEDVLRYFHGLKDEPDCDPDKLVIGLTATPNRSDNVGLERVFDKIVYQKPILPMMEEGWLSDVEAYRVWTDHDISTVSTYQGDLAIGELEEAINTPERNLLVVNKYKELGKGAPGLAFTVDIQHSEDLASMFRNQGVNALALSSRTPDAERKEAVRAYRAGELTILVSCGVLCLDEATEILTRQGWRRAFSISREDEVANWDDGKVFFAKPKAIVVRKKLAGERMVAIVNQRHSIRVTGNHRVVYKASTSSKRWRIAPAETLIGQRIVLPVSGVALPDAAKPTQPKPPSERELKALIRASSYTYRKRGVAPGEAKRLAIERINRRYGLRYKNPTDLSLDECSLIGFWIGDGSVCHLKRGGREYTLCQSIAYPAIIQWVDKLLARLGIDFVRREHPVAHGTQFPYVTWHFSRGTGFGPQQRNGIFPLEPYLRKSGSDLLWGLGEGQLAALLEGLWRADGDHGSGITVKHGFRIYSTNRKFLDRLQAVAACRGYYTSITLGTKRPGYKQLYGGFFRKQKAFTLAKQKFHYLDGPGDANENVWCVTTDSGKIITRRHGKVVVLGNSEGFDAPVATVGLMSRPTKSTLLFCQQLGRLLRPFPAPEDRATHAGYQKQRAIIIDFVDNSGRHRLINVPSLFGLRADFDLKGKSLKETTDEIEQLEMEYPGLDFRTQNSLENMRALVERIDLFRAPVLTEEVRRRSRFGWLQQADGSYHLALPEREALILRENHLGQWEIYHAQGGVRVLRQVTPNLQTAFHYGDQMVPTTAVGLVLTTARWRNDPPTEPQAGVLFKYDRQLRRQFNTGKELYQFILRQYEAGNMDFSKGEISKRIDGLFASRR